VVFEVVSTYFIVYEASFVVCGYSRDIRLRMLPLLFMPLFVVCN
jgi:hypothetical protein